jgi:hypothetical protein
MTLVNCPQITCKPGPKHKQNHRLGYKSCRVDVILDVYTTNPSTYQYYKPLEPNDTSAVRSVGALIGMVISDKHIIILSR